MALNRVWVLQLRQMHDAYWIGKLQKRRAGMNKSPYLAWTEIARLPV
jgi:hypothetical protein